MGNMQNTKTPTSNKTCAMKRRWTRRNGRETPSREVGKRVRVRLTISAIFSANDESIFIHPL